jgi:hypothetical protein
MKSYAKQTSCQPLFLALAATLWLLAVAAADAASYSATVLADQPAVYYRLEDPSGSTAVTNAAYPGVYDAIVIPDDYGAWPKFEQPGIGSNSVSFHLYTPEGGTAQKSHIELAYAPELNTAGPFTAECWVRPTSWGTGPNDWRCPVGNFGGWGDSSGWHFYQSPAVGGASSWIWVQKGGNIWLGGDVAVTKNKWDYLAAIWDGTRITFYVNGVEDGSFTDPTPRPNSGQPFTIGGDPAGGWYFDGSVDEVAIYTNALTVDQLKLHYAVGLTNFFSGPIAAYVTEDPPAAAAYAGRTATFVVGADGTTPLSYQWYKGNTAIPGATGDTLAFTCAYADNGANYKVVVTNLYGSATSAPAALTVMTDLTMVSSPASVTRTVGSKAAFIAVPGGALPVSYKWFKGSTEIPGATNQTLWLSNIQFTDDGTTYYAQINNPWASTNSDSATLTVTNRAVAVPITGYAKVVMADDPVAFWRLDEPDGSTTAVDAAGSFDGTYTPGTGTITNAVATGIPHETNNAVSVTGGARVAIPWALELNPHGPFTAEAWFEPASLAADSLDYRTVYSSMGPGPDDSGPNGWLLYQQPNNTFAWVLFNEGWVSSFMGDPVDVIEANTWYHVALTYDGALFHIYVNGHLSASQAYDLFIPNQDGAANLGYREDNGWNPFDGTLDDVAFYNKALTLEQVQAHYLATVRLGITRSGGNIILSWPFGTLQSAPAVTGTYTNVPSATSPITNAIGVSAEYYRVKVQ